ncbi:Fpg/Nei family DNA glycosylase [Tahibacter amnicola]|uniref:DNA-(apurinic or apyrimidinic site) lyase n=1 Tax=Tahibacter amnicola TaxID=2976241 RepID=A0ABY6BK94_9GAMM|nr:DNA-formamidopyrimidine glycosylase family protein [Tahibacter amnicola]UXI69892.1 hypothetical protein N4264_09775 [Tahibacter amnicola]
MPEFPDITVYIAHLRRRIVGQVIRRVQVSNPFVLRTVNPPVATAEGATVTTVGNLGKRIVIGLDGDRYFVIHLMIAGRLRWRGPREKPPGKIALFSLVFDEGTVFLTEAGTKRRASVHFVDGRAALAALDPGGVDPFAVDEATFVKQLREGNHTLKRALTDPRRFSGIGNAYSDEILHRARLSPFALTGKIDDAEAGRLYHAVREVLTEWVERLSRETGDAFPEKVTAFHDEMAAHGRFGKPCPVCSAPIQRIVYAENEANYCPRCQTGGRILADRALSRLLHDTWPRHVDEL